jgi:segregation and condensation protein A
MINKTVEMKLHLEDFEGPLDLLLHLIKNKKLDILDISLIEITDQYIEYIDVAKSLNLDVASDYLVIAAQLIELKSKYMLKQEIFLGDIEVEEEDTAELIKKLIEYEKYKTLSEELNNIFESSLNLEKEEDEFIKFIDEESDKIVNILTNGFNDFQISIDNIVQRMRDNQVVETVIHLQRISPELRKIELLKQIEEDGNTTFTSLLHSADKYYIAVSLLVILELANEKKIALSQSVSFGDIDIII